MHYLNLKPRDWLTGLFFVLLVPAIANGQTTDTAGIIVSTKQGKVQGTRDHNTYVWRGVRYAKAPVGALRFRAPQPLESWTGVQQANAFGPVCPQQKRVLTDGQVQSEDCLYLNIWSPAVDGKKRPVMFWIHGGGFMGGSGSAPLYNGAEIAKKGDVVLVTINYRLGPFGFLYFNDLPGKHGDFDNNLGIRDQVAALNWVKENIAAFGGNPDSVTIFGESAGAISVLTLMTLPSAKGLFHRAISESGTPDALWKRDTATAVTKRFLAMVGVSTDSLEKLRSISADSLNHAMGRLMKKMFKEPILMKLFAPTIDGQYIPEDLLTAFNSGKAANIELLIGTNKNEANLFAKIHLAPETGAELAPYLVRLDPQVKARLFAAYKDYPHKAGVLSLITDGIFTVPSMQVAAAQMAYAHVYMYRFDWCSTGMRLAGLGACHGAELPFVFGDFTSGAGKKESLLANKKKIRKLSAKVQQSWINFAKTGNPDPTGKQDWKSYNTSSRTTLIFNNKEQVLSNPESTQLDAWKAVNIFD